jgi:hypothetical protein
MFQINKAAIVRFADDSRSKLQVFFDAIHFFVSKFDVVFGSPKPSVKTTDGSPRVNLQNSQFWRSDIDFNVL